MYQFQKINEDTYKLIANGKEFTFTRTVDLIKEMQSIDMIATLKVADILAERGETYDNTKLRIQRQENGKTIIDESNLKRLEDKAHEIATQEVLSNIYKKIFGKSPIKLINEVGIDTNDITTIEKFSADITKVLINGLEEKTPIK